MVVKTVRVRACWRSFDKAVVLKALLLFGFLAPSLASGRVTPVFWYWALEDYERSASLQLYGVYRSPLSSFAAQALTSISDSSYLFGDAIVLTSSGSPKLVVLNKERSGSVYALDENRLPHLLSLKAQRIWPFSWNSILALTEDGLLQEVTLEGDVKTFSAPRLLGGLPPKILDIARNRENELVVLDHNFTLHIFPMDPIAHHIRAATKRIMSPRGETLRGEPILLAQGNHVWFGARTLTEVSLHFVDLQANRSLDVNHSVSVRNFSPYAIEANGSLLAKRGVDRVVMGANGGGTVNAGYYSRGAVENWLGLSDVPIDVFHSRVFAVPTELTPWLMNPLDRLEMTEERVRELLGNDLRARYRDRADLVSLPHNIESEFFARYLSDSPVARILLAPVRLSERASAEFRSRFSLNFQEDKIIRVNGRTSVSFDDFVAFVTAQHLSCAQTIAAASQN